MKAKYFDTAIEILLLALLLLAALFFDRRLGIVFSLSKVTWIRTLAATILGVWAIKLILTKDRKFIRTPLDLPVLAYIFSCGIATVTSIQWYTSLVGFYGRYEGFTTLLVYVLLIFITTNYIRSKEQFKRILILAVVAASLMSIYGIIQRAGLDPYAWGGVPTKERVIGTIGQPNFLAAYLDMAFMLGFVLLLKIREEPKPEAEDFKKGKKKKIVKLEKSWLERMQPLITIALITGLSLIYTGMLFTQSRGGLLALIAGLTLFGILVDKKLVLRNWKRLTILGAILLAITAITFANPATSPLGRFAAEMKGEERLTGEEALRSEFKGGAGSRIETWTSGFRIVADHPLFGVGPEVIKMIFPRYETEGFRFAEGFHVKQDRMHNETMDMGVTRGIITLIIYVWLLFTFFNIGIKAWRESQDAWLKLLLVSLLGAAVTYLVQNQFSFGVVAITTLFWVIIGMTASIYYQIRNPKSEFPNFPISLAEVSPMRLITCLAVVIIAGALCYLAWIPYRADIHYKAGKMYLEGRSFDIALKEFEKALKLYPIEVGYNTYYGIAFINQAQASASLEERKIWEEKAVQALKRANRVEPYNADNYFILSRIYLSRGLLPETLEAVQKTLEIDPYYAEAYLNRGAVYERLSQNKEALENYEKALRIIPDLREALAALINLSSRIGQPEGAFKVLHRIIDYYGENLAILENLGRAYAQNKRLNEAEEVFNKMLKINPTHIKAKNNLALVFIEKGQLDKAIETYQEVLKSDPNNIDAHNGLGFVYFRKGLKAKAIDEFTQVLTIDFNNSYARQMLEMLTR